MTKAIYLQVFERAHRMKRQCIDETICRWVDNGIVYKKRIYHYSDGTTEELTVKQPMRTLCYG